GIGEVAVVADGDLAAGTIHDERLGVLEVGTAGGRIADVSDGQLAGQRAQDVFVEDLADEAHALEGAEVDAIRGRDARAFLAAMLQRVESVICQLRGIRVPVNPKQATIMPWPRAVFRVHCSVNSRRRCSDRRTYRLRRNPLDQRTANSKAQRPGGEDYLG